ncbi:MAG: helix-turn-helix domain-containing protein [Eubacterium sp.]
MHINYRDIGNQIRYERKKQNITQEKLAELCNISIPHISNIENANTKVSLPVLVEIANALNCTVDQLLCNSLKNNFAVSSSIVSDILNDCNNSQKAIIMDTIISLKDSLAKHEDK